MEYISYCKPFDNSIIKMSEQSNNFWNISPYIIPISINRIIVIYLDLGQLNL